MSVSQALLAFSASDIRTATSSRGAAPSTGEGANEMEFAKLLAEQQPERLNALLERLERGGLAAMEGLPLADDGKSLPDAVQNWLGQLADLDDARDASPSQPEGDQDSLTATAMPDDSLTEISERWMAWLNEARGSLTPVEPGHAENKLSLVTLAGKSEASATAAQMDSLRQPAEAVALLRTAQPSQSAEVAAFAGKLAEQIDAKTLGSDSFQADTESEDGLGRAAITTQSGTLHTALTARPVNAAAQALGVPFGEQSWSEAAVEKVMWMSSQNLRSVEIRLDPAELGPLEIHIQNRGQEHQIQFVSQNPSVREALEAQMFRLREMFSQQGMDQVNVSVSDGSQGQQSNREAHAGASGRGDQQGQGGQGEITGQSDSLMTTAEAARVSADRLVDYYA